MMHRGRPDCQEQIITPSIASYQAIEVLSYCERDVFLNFTFGDHISSIICSSFFEASKRKSSYDGLVSLTIRLRCTSVMLQGSNLASSKFTKAASEA